MSLHSSIIKTLLNNPLSLSDLQTIAQVSLPTLRKAIQELSDSGWVRVVGQAEANGGRPAMLFGPDDTRYLIVGAHLQLPGMQLIASDLSGKVLDVTEDFSNVVPQPDQVIQRIVAYVTYIHERFPERQTLGIGIAAPGFTNPATGEILSIGRVPDWQNFTITQNLSTLLDLTAHIANDVDCMAFAEFQHTGRSFEQNLAYVGFDEGVKMSLFLNGQIYKGSFGNAGLVVTDFLNSDHFLSSTDHGQFLTILGVNRIFDQAIESLLDTSARDLYAGIIAIGNHRQRFQLILEGAVEGLPICRDIAQSLISVLAVAIANTIYMIQPDILVIGGALSTMPPVLYSDLEAAIRKYLPPLFTNRSVIQQARMSSSNAAALGACYHFLQSYLTDSYVTNGASHKENAAMFILKGSASG